MTRRQSIANILVAVVLAAGLSWAFTEIFSRLHELGKGMGLS